MTLRPYGIIQSGELRLGLEVVREEGQAKRQDRLDDPVPVGRIKGRAWMALVSWKNGPRWDRLFHFVNH